MSKITIAVLTIAAFLYAAWLVFFRKPLPDPMGVTGLRKRFLLAVLLFAGFLGASVSRAEDEGPAVLCYDMVVPQSEPVRMTRAEMVAALKAAWRTMDREKGKEFRAKLDAAVEQGGVRRKVAAMLAVAFDELSTHHEWTRGKGRSATCYRMTHLGSSLYTSRENAMKQLELLEEARKNGSIDEETAKKAEAALAKEIEMLHRAADPDQPESREKQELLVKQYDAGEIVPGNEARDAAGLIVEMEKGESEG